MSLEKISQDGFFFITAADHRGSLKRKLGDEFTKEKVLRIKKDLAKFLSPHSSGFLLDPVYGLEAIPQVRSGLLLSRERTGYRGGENRETVLLKDWNSKKLKDKGADAIKLLIYYNPDKESSKHQERVVKRVSEECKKFGIPLLCEFMLYDVEEKNKDLYLIKSAEVLSNLGIDVLKTEAPRGFNNCKKLNKRVDVPWVVLSGGMDFKNFKESVKRASRAGASGFAGGRAIWQDTFRDKKLLKRISTRRLEELKEIVRDFGTPI